MQVILYSKRTILSRFTHHTPSYTFAEQKRWYVFVQYVIKESKILTYLFAKYTYFTTIMYSTCKSYLGPEEIKGADTFNYSVVIVSEPYGWQLLRQNKI